MVADVRIEEAPALSRDPLLQGRVEAVGAAGDWDTVAIIDGRATSLDLLSEAASIEGALHGAWSVADAGGTTFALGPSGLQVRGPWGFEPSPQGELVSAAGSGTLVVAYEDGRPILWVAGEAGLFRIDGERVEEVLIDGAAVPASKVAWGPGWAGVPASWVVSGDHLYAVLRGAWARFDPPPRADGTPFKPLGLAADARGQLWILVADALLRRAADGVWTAIELPGESLAIVGDGRRPYIWVQTTVGLFQSDENRFWIVASEPEDHLLGVDQAGAAYIQRASALERVSALPQVRIAGLPAGRRVQARTTLRWVHRPPRDGALPTVRVDGVRHPVDPQLIELDPIELSGGPHEARVDVRWADGTETHGTAAFVTGDFVPATWSGDVRPLAAARCAPCHGEGGTAHLLDAAPSFQFEFERILENVEAGTMPLPPVELLTTAEIEVLRSWRAGGYLP